MEVEHDKNVHRILLPVTAAIYRNGMEKPAMRWSYEMTVGAQRLFYGLLENDK